MALRRALLLVPALLVAGCGDPSDGDAAKVPATVAAPAASPPPTRALGDWPMFGLSPARPNATNSATGVTPGNVGTLRRRVVKLPGTVDSSPIVLRVPVAGVKRDVAFATTTYGRTLAVDLDRGRILWTTTPKGYAGWAGTAQITNASPAADPSRRFVYAASPDGLVHKLSVADGREATDGAWPVRVTKDPTHEKLTSSFNVVGGDVVITTGGYVGDQPPYQGHVVRIDGATGKVEAVFNSLCSDRREIIQPSSCKGQESAIWGRGGAVLDPASGDLLVASSNGPFDGRTNWGDSVLRLDAETLALNRNWTPKEVDRYEREDVDLGSTSPAVLGGGLVLQSGKDGLLHLLDAKTLNGRTGPASAALGGELQNLPTPGGQQTFTAPATWRHGGRTTVFVATGGGTAAYAVRGRRLTALWANGQAGTSPVVAGGLLWVFDPTGGGLRAYQPSTGRVVRALPAGMGHWNSPVITRGHVVLPEGNANDHLRTGVLDIYSRP